MRAPRWILFALLLVPLAFAAEAHANQDAAPRAVEINVSPRIEDGTDPGIVVRHLAPGSEVRVHALRSLEKWRQDGETWSRVRQPLHAHADFVAAADGTVRLDAATPTRGTYRQTDPLGLLWSGRRFGDPALAGVREFAAASLESAAESRVLLVAEQDGAVVAEAAFELAAAAREPVVSEHRGKDWHLVYARPDAARDLPAVVILHGSEGGGVEKARARALTFAARGFAALAVSYFAYPHEAIEGVPAQHALIRLEVLSEVRAWIRERSEISSGAFRVVGTSKGAEFALLAASRFDWITSVVAIVPTDVAWEGYSAGGGVGTSTSSWSFAGAPVPFVPLFQFDPTKEGLYRTNTERYERSRAFHPDRAASARIPIERSTARILLLASDRDEVWASGDMTRALVEALTAAGQSQRVEVRIYPRAGHQIAGTGTFPVRLYGEDSDDPEVKDLTAEGEAAADAWRRTLRFLAR